MARFYALLFVVAPAMLLGAGALRSGPTATERRRRLDDEAKEDRKEARKEALAKKKAEQKKELLCTSFVFVNSNTKVIISKTFFRIVVSCVLS